MSGRKKTNPAAPPRPLHEELEPRLLLSAGVEAALFADAQQADAILDYDPLPPAVASNTVSSTGTANANNIRQEIVFVDAATPNAESLVAALRASAASGGRELEVILLGNTDGIEQISQTLTARGDLSAIHIISHGSDGTLKLGGQDIDSAALERMADTVRGWSDALDDDADILLYGCDLGANADRSGFRDPAGHIDRCRRGGQRRPYRTRKSRR